MQRAFTLIELLIVVAIILILIAIALPNFLEAQLRSKVARVLAEHRTVATAIEAYQTDFKRYPDYNNPNDYTLFAGEAVVFLPVSLTTPIPYLNTLPTDVFRGNRTGMGNREPIYFYMNDYEVLYLGKHQAEGHVQQHYRSLTGASRGVQWTVWAFGPDKDDDHGIRWYNPTNGTVSDGDFTLFGP